MQEFTLKATRLENSRSTDLLYFVCVSEFAAGLRPLNNLK